MTLYSSIYPTRELPKKPVIVAICGKSATGKDTLAAWLLSMLKAIDIPTNIIVSDTTRPPRLNEQSGLDYNFLDENEFHNKINSNQYLEYSNFNGWFYGTDKHAILNDSINIGVFNIDGISSLAMHSGEFEIICVYLKCNLYQRLKRSINREGCFKLEYLRRAKTDYHDFKKMNKMLIRFPNYFVFDSFQMSVIAMADHIIYRLKIKNLLPPYNKSQ